jgi:hypothetical protein
MTHLLETRLLVAEPAPITDARHVFARHVAELGYSRAPRLLAVDSNAKCALDRRVTIATLTLSPHKAGDIVTCAAATAGCASACVLGHGRGSWESTKAARAMRVTFADAHPSAFLSIVTHELVALATRHRSRLRVRLNVASDVRWENVIGEQMVRVHETATANVARYRRVTPTFYDYTKLGPSSRSTLGGAYRIVYSVSERAGTLKLARRHLTNGGTAAIVVAVAKGAPVPTTWNGSRMVDGDRTDDRTTDPAGSWVALRAKGRAIGDTTGFVHNL